MSIRAFAAIRNLLAVLLAATSHLPIDGGAPAPAAATDPTALDRYVAQPDPSYAYELVKTISDKGYTAYVLDMTSQTWRSPSEVDRTAWKHWVTIIRPDTVASQRSLLWIGGGNNSNPAPESVDRQLAQIAVATSSVVTELRMVPNQPLTFSDEKKPRAEDALVAYTWDKFLRTGDELWPARLPMTKAVVRAMDTVSAFLAGDARGGLKVDSFVLAGTSKRGWTAWTTAAVDKRVAAIVPIVIDMLNIEPSFQHHLAAYGYYAPVISEYEQMGIMKWAGTPQYKALMKIEEPYEYRQRLALPKFIINATGDPFFLPDSWRFYHDQLPGVKYLRYVPNADHSLGGTDVYVSLQAWYNAVLGNASLPRFDWNIDKDGTIRLKTVDQPSEIKLWQITNPSSRDFRLATIGPRWSSTLLNPGASGEYSAKVPAPRRGWTAFMIELTFPAGLGNAPFTFTTGVNVTPDTLPFLKESRKQTAK